jgi:hypothetical protein
LRSHKTRTKRPETFSAPDAVGMQILWRPDAHPVSLGRPKPGARHVQKNVLTGHR